MKFLQLDLRAYGPFTNRSLSLDGAGMHLILGGNEAGKSTALRALQAVLFGMKEKRDAHLHPWDMLRVGLRIETTDGTVMDVERRKGSGAKSLLFTGTDRAVPAQEWTRVMPVDDAELFEQMFGLNYDRLVEGGRRLAEFKGDIGQALLAAAGDLGQLVNRMQGLQDEADAIYAAGASSRKLNKALSEYNAADKATKHVRYTSRDYKVAVAKREELVAELEKLAKDLAKCAAEQNRLTRLQTAAPHVNRLLLDEKDLCDFPEAVLMPADFEQRFLSVSGDLRGASDRQLSAESELKRLHQELADIPRDAPLAGLSAEIDSRNVLSGKIQAARVDCPKLVATWIQHHIQREQLCASLGIAASALPHLNVEERERIGSLSGRHLLLEAKRDELPGVIALCRKALSEVDLEIAALSPETDTAELAQKLSQMPKNKQPEADLQRLRQERDSLAKRLHRDTQALPLWAGTPEQLETLRVPLPASVSEFGERFVKQESRESQSVEAGRKMTEEVESCNRGISILEKQGVIPTEAGLAALRARRELGWTAVKDCWLAGINDGAAESSFLQDSGQPLHAAYETAVTTADGLADQLREEADRVEQKRSALDNRDRANRRLAEHRVAVEAIAGNRLQIETAWYDLWANAGIAPRTPREMLAWLEKRGQLIDQLRDLNRVREQELKAEEEVSTWRESLIAALGETAERSLVEMVSTAERLIRQAAETRKKRGELEVGKRKSKSDLDAAGNEQRLNESALSEWRGSWALAVTSLRMSDGAEPAAVKKVVTILDQIADLSGKMESLQHRIETMQRDEREYTGTVQELAVRAGRTALSGVDSLVAIGRLQEAARAAGLNESSADAIAKNLSREQRKLGKANDEAARYVTALAELRDQAQVSEVSLLPEAIRQSQQRTALMERIKGHRKALIESCGNVPVDTFVAQVQELNLDELPAELELLAQRSKHLQVSATQKTSDRDAIDREFQLREAATELSKSACDKYSAAARIDALASEYLERQLGATLLNKAMELYRAKHQDPLLKRAGEYFSALTCGAFDGLAIDYEDKQRVLKGVRSSNRERLDVTAMSDGTRDQLFFALRLAYIENHSGNEAPCPVILDDVLMAFDDARASAALRVLQQLSRKTQVLVFTHHTHHVQLAENVLGSDGFQLHNLTTEKTSTA